MPTSPGAPGVGWGQTGNSTPTPGTSPGWKLPEPSCPASPASSHGQSELCAVSCSSPGCQLLAKGQMSLPGPKELPSSLCFGILFIYFVGSGPHLAVLRGCSWRPSGDHIYIYAMLWIKPGWLRSKLAFYSLYLQVLQSKAPRPGTDSLALSLMFDCLS